MALPKEAWLKQIKEGFYPDTTFLNFVTDYTAYVNNDKLHLPIAGLDPDVLIDNTTYPVEIAERTDSEVVVEIQKFETKNTVVRRPEAIELAYNKLESVIRGHRNVLRTITAKKAAHAFAPAQDSSDTPVLSTTGDDNGDGIKRITVGDILKLKRKFDELDVPKEKRFLVLHPKHLEDLILFDLDAFKEITDFKNGKPNTFAGFRMLEFTHNARYNKSTLEKVPYDDDPAATDTFCSFAFSSEEVFKADGDFHIYQRVNDPEERGTIVGFDKRFLALPIRNKAIGAIVAVDAA